MLPNCFLPCLKFSTPRFLPSPFLIGPNPFYPASVRGKIFSLHKMVPRARENTTLDPSANPFQALGEAFPDPLSVAGGHRRSVVVESRAPTPSLLGASPSPFTGRGAGPLPFAANPPTAKRPRSDTSYLPGFTSETDPKSYWVQRFAAAAAAQENPGMDALVTTIAGFLAEIQANLVPRADG